MAYGRRGGHGGRWLGVDVPTALLENVVMVGVRAPKPPPSTPRLQLGDFFRYPTRHGFLEDIRADAGRHMAIEQTVDTAECAVLTLRCM